MQRVATIIILLVYLSGVFRMAGPVAGYLVNQSYIADVLCINKDKPELACGGKCFLMQKLKETNQNPASEEQTPSGTVESFEPFQHIHQAANSNLNMAAANRLWLEFIPSHPTECFLSEEIPPPRFSA